MADFIYLLETRLTPDQQRALALVTDVARAHEMNIFLTGGAVRDILSGFIIRDLDFAVQGNPLKLHKDFEKAGATIEAVDESTRTIMLLLPGNVRGEVTAIRSEKYEKPGKAPEITQGTIYDDMRRRDFTVNAMALSLNPGWDVSVSSYLDVNGDGFLSATDVLQVINYLNNFNHASAAVGNDAAAVTVGGQLGLLGFNSGNVGTRSAVAAPSITAPARGAAIDRTLQWTNPLDVAHPDIELLARWRVRVGLGPVRQSAWPAFFSRGF